MDSFTSSTLSVLGRGAGGGGEDAIRKGGYRELNLSFHLWRKGDISTILRMCQVEEVSHSINRDKESDA